jgi:hypothetical protein
MSAAWMKKHWFKTVLLALIGIVTVLIGSCAFMTRDREVSWEEEVLLNTGETIWVKKEVRYTIQGQAGNPLDLGYVPDRTEATSFKYGGRAYSYRGDASEIMVLAISPNRQPVLLAPADSRHWGVTNNYKCTKPYYVQLMPDVSGQKWTWPTQIEPWTYNLPTNLMLERPHPSNITSRYTNSDKSKQGFWSDPQVVNIQKVNPDFTTNNCIKAN